MNAKPSTPPTSTEPPAPALAGKKAPRQVKLLWPLIVLGLLLLYNAVFSPKFYEFKLLYDRIEVQTQAPLEIHKTTDPTSPVVAIVPKGTTLRVSQMEMYTDKYNGVSVQSLPGGAHQPEENPAGYIPPTAPITVTLKQGWHLSATILDIFRDGSKVMMLALGMTLVIATGGIDLSVGSVMAVAGCVAASVMAPKNSIFESWQLSNSLYTVVSLVLLSGLLAGSYNGTLVALFGIQPIVATLVLMISARGVADVITGGFKPTYAEELNPHLNFIGHGLLFNVIPFPLVIVALFMLMMSALTRLTAMGLYIESIGNNAAAAAVVGIRAKFVKFFVYAFCGICASVAGLIQTADLRIGAPYDAGLYKELDAIVAVALGGTSLVGGRFSLAGSLLGALIMQTLTTTILQSRLPPEFTLIVEAIVVLLICLLQSDEFRTLFRRLYRQLARGVS